jgi:hypothetical protein
MRTCRTVCGAIAAAIDFCLLAVGCSSPQSSVTATPGDTLSAVRLSPNANRYYPPTSP